MKFLINIVAEYEAQFDFRCGLVIFDHLGSSITKIISPCDAVFLRKGETHSVEMLLNPVQLGPGEYILSISLHKHDVLEKFNSTGRYDLVARCSVFTITMPESILPLSAAFMHTAEWSFERNNS